MKNRPNNSEIHLCYKLFSPQELSTPFIVFFIILNCHFFKGIKSSLIVFCTNKEEEEEK